MTQEMYNICEKVAQGLKVQSYNEKMSYISRIFKYYKYLGIDERQSLKNKYWFNDKFDILYSLRTDQLEEVDQYLYELSSEHIKSLIPHHYDE